LWQLLILPLLLFLGIPFIGDLHGKVPVHIICLDGAWVAADSWIVINSP
jgi:hypothetical protein